MAFDWDDVRIFMAAARAGSLTSAAGRLGIDQATVGRRIARLETALSCTLLTRSPSGLQRTAAGNRLFEAGLDAETAMSAAARADDTETSAGAVRISTSEGFGISILAPALMGLRQQQPGLTIELAASSSGLLSPSRREVDMAITLSAPADPRLSVEPLTDYQLALYASPAYLAAAGLPGDLQALRSHDLTGYVDDLIYAPELRYLEEIFAGLRPAIASSSILAQYEIIAAGGGIGVLPCFLAEGLTPVLLDEVLLTRRFWISTHTDVAGLARMRAVRRWLFDLVKARRTTLMPF